MAAGELVEGRDCGECTVCCAVLAIDDPDIQKTAGVRCRHCGTSNAGGCTIYQERPRPCRELFCAWRQLEMLDDEWRPDRSGVFAFLEKFEPPESAPPESMRPGEPLPATAITFMLTGDAETIVRQKWFVKFVCANIVSGQPVYLSLPAPPGYIPHRILLYSPSLTAAARDSGDRIVAVLEQALLFMSAQAFREQVFAYSGNDVSTAADCGA